MTADTLKFIDAHHHLWDLQAVHYPWLMARGERRFFGDPAPIQKNYLMADFLGESTQFRPAHSVHVQVGAADGLAETRWLDSLPQGPAALVAFCDLDAIDAPAQLEAQRQFAGVRGIRQIVGRHASEDARNGSGQLLGSPHWQQNLGALAEMGLSFDLQMVPQQMPALLRVLRRLPQLPVALCHAGSPWEQSGSGWEAWKMGLRALAQLPNVHCKISGLGMFNPEWTVDGLRPITDHVIDCFGEARVMFGSNFPVDKLYRGYSELWQAYFSLLEGTGDTARRQMLFDNAARFYRITG
ncbi:amidohydrolase family protein [Microbulbifer salipaludis]|uniref:Amidohydrolase family protein n=1 Tax=Microbulbifer salipaludis TaxID=187980 RepID=A0ABS3E7M2_9GAMM|nr:amidohydrolase family protein [Microbulbifer salipaludis]